jgi:tetratricopeptide (TPR) repeat protein
MTETEPNKWGPYRVQPDPRALAQFALGSACTVATLLCIPDGVGLIPAVSDPGVWAVRIAGLWLSAAIQWFLGILGLLHIARMVSGGLYFDQRGLKLWRFGKPIQWWEIAAVSAEPQEVFSRVFLLKPTVSRLVIYTRKGEKLQGHSFPTFQFSYRQFKSVLETICRHSFNLIPDSVQVIVTQEDSEDLLRKQYERSAKVRLAFSVFISVSLVLFLGRRAAVNYEYNVGSKLFRVERYAQAAEAYALAAKIDPTFAPSWDQLARSELRSGQVEKAEEHWLMALRMKPGMTDARVGLANVRMRKGQLKQAQEMLQKAVHLDSRNTAAVLSLVSVEHALGNRQVAIQLLRSVQFDNGDVYSLVSAAKLSNQMQLSDQAALFAQRALAADPSIGNELSKILGGSR